MIRENDEFIKNKKARTDDEQPKVTAIKEDSKFSSISDSIYNNPYLESLFITSSRSSIYLPREFSKLAPSLTSLSFAHSKISNIYEISKLTNLKYLDLTASVINYGIPAEIGNLIQLETLILKFNHLSELPYTFNRLQNLKELNIGNNKFSQFPEVICKFKKLTSLDFNSNLIQVIPECLNTLIELETLNIFQNYISDISPIKNLPKLKELFASSNLIVDIPDTFETLESLEILHLSENKIHKIPDTIGKLTNLRELYAHKNAIRTLSETLINLEHLTLLHLNNNLIYDVPDFDVDKINLDIENNPIMSSYIYYINMDNSDSDITFNEFNKMMKRFPDDNITIINKKNTYITDSILKDQHNPYLVHYEVFEDKSYPIITIPKGTLLFNARPMQSTNYSESYFHLYKLHGKPNLDDYIADDFENVLTYFYPVPFMAAVVDTEYTSMDMVVITKDIRLLCLISPSPITRSNKSESETNFVNNDNMPYYKNNNPIKQCPSRDYDLCLSPNITEGLKLNGYIGIAYSDSLSHPKNADIIKYIANKIDYKSSLLYMCSCFNNAAYKKDVEVAGNNFLERMLDARIYGIPEIVLIPYDYHTYPDPIEYENKYSYFSSATESKSNEVVVDPHFIFKYVDHAVGQETFAVAENMKEILSKYSDRLQLSKSLQTYKLFTMLNSEIETANEDMIVQDEYTFNDVAFPNSYIKNPTSKCAFETIKFYEMLQGNNADDNENENITFRPSAMFNQGYQTRAVAKTPDMSLKNQDRMIGGTTTEFMRPSPSISKFSSIEKIKRKKSVAKEKPQALRLEVEEPKPRNRKIVTDRFYYNEVSDIPIFAFKKQPTTNKNSGGNKYKSTLSKTKKLKKMKRLRKNKSKKQISNRKRK